VRPNARRGGRGRRRHDAARLLGRSRQFSPPTILALARCTCVLAPVKTRFLTVSRPKPDPTLPRLLDPR
jgi:hypothetical protein